MRVAATSCLAWLTLSLSTAYASAQSTRAIEFDGARIVLSLPSGHCPLDATSPREKAEIARRGAAGQAVLLMLAECRQLAEWREGRRGALNDLLVYRGWAVPLSEQSRSRDVFVRSQAEATAQFAQRRLPVIRDLASEFDARMTMVLLSNKVEDPKPLFVLVADAQSIQLVKSERETIRLPDKRTWTRTIFVAQAISLIRNKVISVELVTPLGSFQIDGERARVRALHMRSKQAIEATISASVD